MVAESYHGSPESGRVSGRARPPLALVGLEQFARYQPFTPVTETLRGLRTGTPIGTNAILAVAWSAGITLGAYLWARHLYTTRRSA